MSNYNLGDMIQYRGAKYQVVGLSKMIYDDDCTGEPEWKITKQIQEVAIASPIADGREYHFEKPAWIRISELEDTRHA